MFEDKRKEINLNPITKLNRRRMRYLLLFLLLLGITNKPINAQYYIDSSSCIFSPGGFIPVVDSTFYACDTTPSSFTLVIEPSINNIWTKGKTYKFGTTSSKDTICSIFTDSMVNYAANAHSGFYFVLPDYGWSYSKYFKFWHKFDTDTLMDGCWLEFSNDSGATWYPIDSFANYQLSNVYSYCNLYGEDGIVFQSLQLLDTLFNGRKAWSGSSNGWISTALHLNFMMPITSMISSNPINAIRFVFSSDSVGNNKSGWIINDFSIGHVNFVGGVDDRNAYSSLNFYPNPSSTGEFNIDMKSELHKGTIQIYNSTGSLVLETELKPKLSLSALGNGFYYYTYYTKGKLYRGRLLKY